MLQFEEFGAAADVVAVGMAERDHVEIVALRGLQLFLQTSLQVDAGIILIFGTFAVAEVKKETAAIGRNDLASIAMTDRVENDSVRSSQENLQGLGGYHELALNRREC
ncbi:hypothetical protein MasN3_26630 [Massilia varians]|uniref:Uncharacterized protein n=1 Tax=Massilia varians TaxID=457921 RepID=A0ABM8C7D3_9BURK|nr:hypothetical protein MasN3_26630 [Massilia varians]